MEDKHRQDRAIIRESIENWVVWRDTAHWDEFRKVWHPDGRMTASWKQAGFEEFIAGSHDLMERGGSICICSAVLQSRSTEPAPSRKPKWRFSSVTGLTACSAT